MATKKISEVKPSVRKCKTTVQTITPEQATYFLNRLTTALERVEKIQIQPSPAGHISMDLAAENKMSIKAQAGELLPPANGLGSMINMSLEIASEMYQTSESVLDRLRGCPPANGATNGQKPSSGPMKDGVDMVNSLMYSTLHNLKAIGEYIFA